MRWNLRMKAAEAGIWKSTELRRQFADAGLVISAGKMSALWTGTPTMVRLDDLDVICSVLDCQPSDLLIPEPEAVAAQKPVKRADTSKSAPARARRGRQGEASPSPTRVTPPKMCVSCGKSPRRITAGVCATAANPVARAGRGRVVSADRGMSIGRRGCACAATNTHPKHPKAAGTVKPGVCSAPTSGSAAVVSRGGRPTPRSAIAPAAVGNATSTVTRPADSAGVKRSCCVVRASRSTLLVPISMDSSCSSPTCTPRTTFTTAPLSLRGRL